MAAREKMFKKSKQISFEGPESLHQKVKAYAKSQGKYIGVAYTEIILAGLEALKKGTQLVLPLK